MKTQSTAAVHTYASDLITKLHLKFVDFVTR